MALTESRRDHFRTLAADWNCGYVDVTNEWIDTEVQAGYDPAVLARDAWLPLHVDDEGYVLVAVAAEPTIERVALIEAAVGAPVCLAVTSDVDLAEAIRQAYPQPMGSRSRFRFGWVIGAVALLVLAGAVVLAPVPTLVVLALLTSAGFLAGVGATVTDHPAAPLARAIALPLTPLLYALFLAALVLPAERVFPAWSVGITMASLLAGNTALVHADLLDAFRRGGAVAPALRAPLRWLLDSAAALRRPLTREKARHGDRTVHSGDTSVAAVEPG
ncbi:hypothetical protein Ais01nite_56380 [Asanoa ishikariensis]|uniref:Type II secretion system (T2SS), protein E, N-terminal domain n=1 Tax=Asanoa ishikariensis TaxID=137265 RepID=A0A1H3TWD8_9ACTN|nr:hypothetical protein [Asanoa ishikariensis]GIF67603.1 hypothetical protein Ais01nite_56380 [Asanoa ishikariensis]SDZ54540.1 Type II secretion system (T2SS), protein E, N-terminal domain [Asanoa ishikariensis]